MFSDPAACIGIVIVLREWRGLEFFIEEFPGGDVLGADGADPTRRGSTLGLRQAWPYKRQLDSPRRLRGLPLRERGIFVMLGWGH